MMRLKPPRSAAFLSLLSSGVNLVRTITKRAGEPQQKSCEGFGASPYPSQGPSEDGDFLLDRRSYIQSHIVGRDLSVSFALTGHNEVDDKKNKSEENDHEKSKPGISVRLFVCSSVAATSVNSAILYQSDDRYNELLLGRGGDWFYVGHSGETYIWDGSVRHLLVPTNPYADFDASMYAEENYTPWDHGGSVGQDTRLTSDVIWGSGYTSGEGGA